MHITRLFALAASSVLISGCTTTPRYVNADAADAACIKGDLANFVKFYSDGEAHVQIKEVDDVAVVGREICVSPGKHRVTVSGYNILRTAQGPIEFTFAPKGRYWVRGNYRDGDVLFRLIDVTGNTEILLSEFRLTVNQTHQLQFLPSGIPIVAPK